ncbi:hypothetical protein HMPREF3056_04980 [Corynebacterium sp. HMSC056F09]|nr:hypothetical protein HMPREF3056_04980 [Corynebacterium sp. HMSC056F09]
MHETTVTILITNTTRTIEEILLGHSEVVEYFVSVSVVAVDEKLSPVIGDARSSVLVTMAGCLHLGTFTGFEFAVVETASFYGFDESLIRVVSAIHFENFSFMG